MKHNNRSLSIKKQIGWLIVPLALVLLQGCASERIRLLDDALKVYGDTIRWGRFEDAAQMVVNKPSFDEKTSANIKVTSYKERQRDVDEDGKMAKTTVEIRYYNKEIGQEHSLTDKQEWKYFEDPDGWMLTSEMPKFK